MLYFLNNVFQLPEGTPLTPKYVMQASQARWVRVRNKYYWV
jgi:hypothetical protein